MDPMGPDARKVQAAEASGAPALAHLRAVTQQAHAALEEALPLLGPSLSVAQYQAYLCAIVPVVEEAERLVAHSAPALARQGFDWTRRRRAMLLVSDLHHLTPASARCPPPALSVSAPSVALAAFDDEAGRMGLLYVLEGSTLGGQRLCRHLQARLALGADSCRYLCGHGRKTGVLWRQTCAVLERILTAAPARQRAGRAASVLFALFHRAIVSMPTSL